MGINGISTHRCGCCRIKLVNLRNRGSFQKYMAKFEKEAYTMHMSVISRARSSESYKQHRKTRLSITDWRTSTEVLHKAVRRPDPVKISLSSELTGFVWPGLKIPQKYNISY